jgi:hypothetical protein
MIRKAGQDDPEAFAQVVAILETVPDQLRLAVHNLRKPMSESLPDIIAGYSWADIAAPLGVTRSAAQQRFGLRRDGLLDS